LFIRMIRDTSKSFGKSLCITMSATWTYLGAASHRIPSCVGPLNFGISTHGDLNVLNK
jgi:hypothetical protein